MFNVIFYNLSNTETSPQIEPSRINLKSLKNGERMLQHCTNLESFTSDLSSLTNGSSMFYGCIALTSFSSDLSSLKNGNAMFYYCTALKTFDTDLSSLTDGEYMFQGCINLESFSYDLPSLTNGNAMFQLCRNLTTFNSDLSSLKDGSNMFNQCTNLESFNSDLSSLLRGYSMFYGCENLTSFNIDLPNLTDGYGMFQGCKNLTTFSSDLSSLTYASWMFYNCENLKSFSYDLPNLVNGYGMFQNCTTLTTFSSDLSSLTNGSLMFEKCKLNAESVMYIADSIKDIASEKQLYINGTIPYVTYNNTTKKYSAPRGFMSDGKYVFTYVNNTPYTTTIQSSEVGLLTLCINVSNNANTIKQQLEDFAKKATFESWDVLKTHFSKKGWKVTFKYGGTTTSITYDLRNGEQIIPCSIFAKLVEVDKDSAQYCTEDASTFYNIEWGHDVTDTSSYTQFNSLEDAMTSWNVFPKENIISTEE